MPEDVGNSVWQEDCEDKAVEASHLAGPIMGGTAAALTLGTALAESEVPPLALETAAQTQAAYELGKEAGGPLVGLGELGVCEGAHVAGEGAHYLNDEVHQGAQGVADYIDSHFIDPSDSHAIQPSESAPSEGQPIHDEPTSVLSPDQAAVPPEGATDPHVSDSSSWLSSISSEVHDLIGSAQHAEQSLGNFWDAPLGTLPHEEVALSASPSDQHDSGLSSWLGGSSDNTSADPSSDSHASAGSSWFGGSSDSGSHDSSSEAHGGLVSSLFGSTDSTPSDSHDSGGSSWFDGSSDSGSHDSTSDSHGGMFSSLFGGSSDSPSEVTHSFFDSGAGVSHDSDSSFSSFSGGSSDHDSSGSSGVAADT